MTCVHEVGLTISGVLPLEIGCLRPSQSVVKLTPMTKPHMSMTPLTRRDPTDSA